MASTRSGPNPLRPYYTPPSIELYPDSTSATQAAATASSKAASAARELLSDLDYSDYIDASPSVSDWFRDLLDRAVWRYSKVLMAQPFDVAKTILQIYVVPDSEDETTQSRRGRRLSRDNFPEQDSQSSDDDESSYFTSSTPATPSSSTHQKPRRSRRDIPNHRSGRGPSGPAAKHQLQIKNPSSLMEVISQLWSTSGPTSVWKATNATFIYSLLLPTLNTFLRSLLAAILGLPEDGSSTNLAEDILTAASPGTTLVLSCISSSLSALILSPIDTARTFLIATPLTHGPRSLVRALRLLPQPNYLIPPHLIPITILHSSLPNLLTLSTPLFLKSYFAIDPVINPSTWSFFTFLASGLELGVRFPLETVLRRAQIATFTSPTLRQTGLIHTPTRTEFGTTSTDTEEIKTIVPTPRSYRGVIGTMWSIIWEEGSRTEDLRADSELGGKVPSRRKRQGQGIEGLYRGWRVGMWGLVGVWGAGFLGAAVGGNEEDIVTSPPGAGVSSGPRGRARQF
ncbi:hypothetical protein VTN49DRAFT_5241 [Thermomyces lanuginosus]|uniref:uncharacterized protein n=1 Tax=Thermomyces lanuginosus TaxID=5541 RepID=UPI0037443A3C